METSTVPGDANGAVTAYLELLDTEGARPAVFPLRDQALIGREAQDSLASGKFLCIPDHTVSRRHARIKRRGDAYFVEDLHSFNGTFVLGKRIEAGSWHPLRDGDELAVSSARMVFHSLLVPVVESMPSIITKTVDATVLSRMDAAPAPTGGDVDRTVRQLHAMAQVGIALGVVTDRGTLTEKIMNFIFDLFPLAHRHFLLRRKRGGGAAAPGGGRRRDGTVEDPAQARMSSTIIAQVLNNKQAVLSVDALADRHFGSQESIIGQAIRSVMCAPLLLEGECLGLIQVDTSSDPHAFKEQDLEMLNGVCAETAVVLKNFQLYSDIERLLDGFVRASVQAIEERDPATAGHSFRVAGYAEALARAVDRADDPEMRHIVFSDDQLREVRYAALLHDFGKVGVREHVLRKEKKLHRSDMLLLEQRFRYARACMERDAYRGLVEAQAQGELSLAEFHARKRRIEEELSEEFIRLDRFLAAIRHANEPAISDNGQALDLSEVLEYAWSESGGLPRPLLEPDEFSALCVPRGCLTPDERRQIETHVADSYSFLVQIPWTGGLAGVPGTAHGHHEKLDGSGYPMGLRGDQISPQTRILTICDIYDALTAGDRPYKKAVPVEQALDLLASECAAGHLDGGMYRVFVESRAWSAA